MLDDEARGPTAMDAEEKMKDYISCNAVVVLRKNKTMMSHLLAATTRKTAYTTTQTFCGRRQTSLDLLKFGLMLRLRELRR